MVKRKKKIIGIPISTLQVKEQLKNSSVTRKICPSGTKTRKIDFNNVMMVLKKQTNKNEDFMQTQLSYQPSTDPVQT